MKSKWIIRISVLAISAFLVSLIWLITQFLQWADADEKIKLYYEHNADTVVTVIVSIVDKLLNEMEFGAIAFNTPTHINIDDSPEIQLILSFDETVDELKQSITEVGDMVGATIKVSDIMEAHLSGDMFDITAIIPEKQAVSRIHRTEWKWEIHPIQGGNHKLHLTITVILEINGDSVPRTIKTFDRIIEVNVTVIQKVGLIIKSYWQVFLTAIIIPFGVWLWKRRKKS